MLALVSVHIVCRRHHRVDGVDGRGWGRVRAGRRDRKGPRPLTTVGHADDVHRACLDAEGVARVRLLETVEPAEATTTIHHHQFNLAHQTSAAINPSSQSTFATTTPQQMEGEPKAMCVYAYLLAQRIATDLNDGEVLNAARGAAGTLILSAGVMALLAGCWLVLRALRPLLRQWLTTAASPEGRGFATGRWLWRSWLVIYGLVIIALVLQSFSLHWPFPRIIAATFSLKAWGQFLFDAAPLMNSMVLAMLTSVAALAACLIWFETQSSKRDGIVLAAATLVLCLPALLLALGQYRLLLLLGWTGTWPGLLLAHVLFVLAYVFIMLQGPYRAYDQRWQAVSHGLATSRIKFLLAVKLPMLKAPILSALAVGFAVSVAQYVPSQLAGAGRISTLPIEAVTLSSGGNRALISVAALLLMALPLLAFQFAARFGQPRWRAA